MIVCSDHQAAKDLVMGLTPKIPNLRPVDGGILANAKYVEQITPLLVNINRIYKGPRRHQGGGAVVALSYTHLETFA